MSPARLLCIHAGRHFFSAIIVLFAFLFLTACSTGMDNAVVLGVTAVPPTNEPSIPPSQTLTATGTPAPTSTQTPEPTASATHTRTVKPSITPTPESARMDLLVQRLYAEDVIHSLEGQYTAYEDFDQSWAQLYWYQWYRLGKRPENFIIRTDAAWESASRTANWTDSGCGFVFSEKDADNHHAVFVTMDGYVRTHKFKGGVLYDQKAGYYTRFVTPRDSAELILVVEDQVLTVLVNGEIIVQYEDAYIQRGHVSLSLASGTNKDFGTKCEMRNIDYWSIQ